MALDYLQELKKFSDGGGTDIGAFLKQHTAATQTTPGPSVPAPVSDITPPPTAPNIVKQAMAPIPPAATGAVASLPARNPIASRNLYPPQSNRAGILGERRQQPMETVQPAQPAAPRPAPNAFSGPVLGTSLAQPAVDTPRNDTLGAKDAFGTLLQFGRSTGLGAKDENGNLLQGEEERSAGDRRPFAAKSNMVSAVQGTRSGPGASSSALDVLPRTSPSGRRVAENDSPPGAAPYSSGPLANPKPSPKPSGQNTAMQALPRRRNQRAVLNPTIPRIFSGVV